LKLNKYIVLAFLLIPLNSCKEEESFHLDESKMIQILVDIHIAEAAIQNMTSTIKDSLGTLYYGQIYQIHEVEEAFFLEDFERMRSNPEDTRRIYEKVLEEISKMEAKIKGIDNKKKK